MTSENIYCIYMHTSPSGKAYIGQTNNYNRRCNEHRSSNKCIAFASAIDKYGWDNFTHEILEEGLTLEESNIREVYWMEFHNTLTPNGYNLRTGGNNFEFSEETLKKMSEAKIEKYMGENSYMWGKFGENSPSSKKYIITFPDGHEEITLCMKSFCEEYNLNASHMSTIATGNGRQKTCKGYKCRIYGSIEFVIVTKENLTSSKKYIITFPDGHEEIIIGLSKFCNKYNLTASNMSTIAKGNSKYKAHKGYKCAYYIE